MFITKKIFFLAAAVTSLLFASCTSSLTCSATGTDGAAIKFSAGFSKEAEQSLRDIISAASGLSGDAAGASTTAAAAQTSPLFSADEISGFLKGAGVQGITAKSTADNKISAAGTIPSVSTNTISKAGILSRTPSSIKLTLGPDQINSIYENLDEDSQGYFDLLMIPCLTGETMTQAEYSELLSSVYGPVLAKEIVNGKMNVLLLSPDGKKSASASIALGELLTLTSTKSWSVNW